MSGRILVIDDSFIVLAYVEEVLRKGGHTVVIAEDWAEARNIMKRHDAFHVVLIDVNLPGMRSGDSLAKSLRLQQKAQNARFVYFSAESDEQLEQLTKISGMDGYITKGQDDEKFLKDVEAFIREDILKRAKKPVKPSFMGEEDDGISGDGDKKSWWKE